AKRACNSSRVANGETSVATANITIVPTVPLVRLASPAGKTSNSEAGTEYVARLPIPIRLTPSGSDMELNNWLGSPTTSKSPHGPRPAPYGSGAQPNQRIDVTPVGREGSSTSASKAVDSPGRISAGSARAPMTRNDSMTVSGFHSAPQPSSRRAV